jgi:hypothetical protein
MTHAPVIADDFVGIQHPKYSDGALKCSCLIVLVGLQLIARWVSNLWIKLIDAARQAAIHNFIV